jgi:hypothetical protein
LLSNKKRIKCDSFETITDAIEAINTRYQCFDEKNREWDSMKTALREVKCKLISLTINKTICVEDRIGLKVDPRGDVYLTGLDNAKKVHYGNKYCKNHIQGWQKAANFQYIAPKIRVSLMMFATLDRIISTERFIDPKVGL